MILLFFVLPQIISFVHSAILRILQAYMHDEKKTKQKTPKQSIHTPTFVHTKGFSTLLTCCNTFSLVSLFSATSFFLRLLLSHYRADLWRVAVRGDGGSKIARCTSVVLHETHSLTRCLTFDLSDFLSYQSPSSLIVTKRSIFNVC